MGHNKYKEKTISSPPSLLTIYLSILPSFLPSFNGCLVGTGSFQHCVGMLCFAERTCGLESYVLKPKQKKQKIAKP
jgi:hypothetical protein